MPSIDQKDTSVIKKLFRKSNFVIKTFLFGKSNFRDSVNKDILTLPSGSYYQESVFLYFQVELSHSQYVLSLSSLVLLFVPLICF